MKRLMLVIVLLLVTSICYGKDWSEPKRPDCGGWENWMQVVVTQDPTNSCLKVKPTEICYTVTIIIYPGGENDCRWDFNVRQATVDNVVKDFMRAYLP